MAEVECEVVRIVDEDAFPLVVEVRLVDAAARSWPFIDKEPIFGIDSSCGIPARGVIRCEVVTHEVLLDGRSVVVINTAIPDGLDSNGVTEFRVMPDAISHY
jgi:hypothetical protein